MTEVSESLRGATVWRRLAAWPAAAFGYVRRRARDARARAEIRSEFARLDGYGELDTMLADCGLSRDAVPEIVSNHPAAPRRLTAMLRRLGITLTASQERSAEIREIERTCLQCAAGRQCDHWLRSGPAGEERQFCPNAEAFDRLRRRPAT